MVIDGLVGEYSRSACCKKMLILGSLMVRRQISALSAGSLKIVGSSPIEVGLFFGLHQGLSPPLRR